MLPASTLLLTSSQDPREVPLCSPGPGTKCLRRLGHIPGSYCPHHCLWAPGTWKSTPKNLGTLAPNLVVLELSLHGNCLEGLFKHRLLVITLRVYDSVKLG